jgi:3-oxoacyl-[acyl-carrier protein] reductase
MNDRYQLFANSPAGRLLTRNLGLPAPLVLDRFDANKPVVNGAVLLGAAPNAELDCADC